MIMPIASQFDLPSTMQCLSRSFALRTVLIASIVTSLTAAPSGVGAIEPQAMISATAESSIPPMDKLDSVIAQSEPEQGSTTARVDQPVTLTFSHPMQPSSFTETSVTLIGPLGSTKVALSFSENHRHLTVTPAEDLYPGSGYTLLMQRARDIAGRPLSLATLDFRTAALLPESATSVVSDASGDDDEAFSPTRDSPGVWRSSRPLPAFVEARMRLPRSTAGATGVSGIVLRLSDRPLAKATISVDGASTRTDEGGRFVLTGLSPGRHEMIVDGSSANWPDHEYPQLAVNVEVKSGKLTELIHPIYLPRIRKKDWFAITSPLDKDLVIRHPDIPDMEIRIPKGTVLRDLQGKVLTRFAVLPVPIERSSIPLPVSLPIAVLFHPGGTKIQTLSGPPGSGGIDLVYPNYAHMAPGTEHLFWAHSPNDNGWMVYALAKVTDDGKQVRADAGPGLQEFVECGGPSLPNRPNPLPTVPPVKCTGGDPVECSSGVFLHQRVDVFLPDVLPIQIERTYRPGDSVVRPFGIGTTHNYAMYLQVSPSGYSTVNLVLPDGAIIDFHATTVTSNGLGTQTLYQHTSSPSEYFGAMLYGYISDPQVGEAWKLTKKDGTQYFFINNATGQLGYVVDRNGNQLSFTYNASNQLGVLTSPNGRYVSFAYDSGGRISSIQDNSGRAWTYTYTAATGGYLQQVTYPDNTTESYAYDGLGRMLTVTDRRGNTMVANTYDSNNRVTLQTYADGTTNAFSYTTTASGQVTQTNITDERGYIKQIQVNAAGYPTSVTKALGKPEVQTWTYARDPSSNLVLSATDSLGRVTTYAYDSLSNVLQRTELYGTSAAATWSYTYQEALDRMLTSTDPLGATTYMSYDVNGNLIQATDPLGHLSNMTYTSSGLLSSATKYPGGVASTTTYGYSGADLISVTDPLGRQSSFDTDVLGRRIAQRDPLGNLTEFSYDVMGRLVQQIDALGDAVAYNYDGNDNLLSFTDARGSITTWQYDVRNRATTKIDALSQAEAYHYDAAGNLTQLMDRKGQVSGYTYDGINRKATAGYGATNNNPTTYTSTIAYAWDAGNRLTKIVDSIGGTLTRGYDGFDNLTSETGPLGSIGATWDATGNRLTLTVSGQASAVNYTWDAAHRLKLINQGAANVSFAYDEVNRRTQMALANNVVVSYGWDLASELSSVTYVSPTGTTLGDLNYGYDLAGRRTSIGGNLASVNLPSVVTSAIYDANNRMTTWGSSSLAYDPNGNMQNDGTQAYTWDARNQLSNVGAASFTYDGVGRRVNATVSGSSTSFLNDGWQVVQELSGSTITSNLLNGPGTDQLLRRTVGTTTSDYLADALGSTLALTSPTGAVATNYSYGAFGSETSTGSVSDNRYQYTGRENDGTGLYYYRARYYHPGFGRFVQSDPIGLQGGVNTYTYARDDPMLWSDPTGLVTCTRVSELMLPFARWPKPRHEVPPPSVPEAYFLCIYHCKAYEQCPPLDYLTVRFGWFPAFAGCPFYAQD